MNATANTETTATAAPVVKALPNRACATEGHGNYTIGTADKGKTWQRYCEAGNAEHKVATTKALPVTTAARFLCGQTWPEYLKAHGNDGGNATARKVALEATTK